MAVEFVLYSTHQILYKPLQSVPSGRISNCIQRVVSRLLLLCGCVQLLFEEKLFTQELRRAEPDKTTGAVAAIWCMGERTSVSVCKVFQRVLFEITFQSVRHPVNALRLYNPIQF